MEKIKFPCLAVTQPVGTFYIGAVKADELVAISYADVRRTEGRDIEKYIGTQRDLNEGRVAEIKQYVTTVDACFPTSVILSISSEHARYDESTRMLTIEKGPNVAKIIDGQHRIAGLEDYKKPFEVNVTIFIDMDIEDQAMVFATINLKQTKVSKSLAYDLFEYTEFRSPQKTCHNIAKLLNFKQGSPFFARVKILGKASENASEVITQATFVDRLLKLITNDPMGVRDQIKRDKEKLKHLKSPEADKYVFWNRFVDGKDAEIAKILWNYFKAVEQRWGGAWNNFEKGKILSKTTGFAALIRLLPVALSKLNSGGSIPTEADFLALFKKSDLQDADFTSDRFKPGSSGEGELYKELSEKISK